MQRTTGLLSLLLFAAPLPAQEVAPDPFVSATVLDREVLVQAVLERNPTLESARQALRAAESRPGQASALDNFIASYALAPRSLGASNVDFGQEIEISQMLPYSGKRRLRGSAAVAEAEAARADVESLKLELWSRASILFDDLYVLDRALEINAEHVALVEEFQRVATARYVAGFASQQDPLQAESELAHLLHDGVVLRSEREVVAAAINALLHRAPDAPLPPPPAELPTPSLELPLDEEGLQAEALAGRPELLALAGMARARQAELDLARLGGRPDLGVMTSYNSMWSDREHRFMVGASVSLPVWRSRIRAAVAEAEARLARARSEQTAREDEVRREVRQAAVRLREAHHVLELYRSRLLPPASDQVQAALAGFKTGRNDFLALIEAQRNQRRVKLGYHEALANLDRNQIDLERAVGRSPSLAPSAPRDAAPVPQGESR